MRKLIIFLLTGAILGVSGCSTFKKVGNAIPNALDHLPYVYRLEIQQGNSIDQEVLNKVKVGMLKSQVRYLMGTPMLIDPFHQDRWDYIFRLRRDGKDVEEKRVAMIFKDDRLVETQGSVQPQPESAMDTREKEVIVTVPDYEAQQKGFFSRMLDTVGLGRDE